MARFLGAENVERSEAYLAELDDELRRYIVEFVYGEVYAGDVLDPKTRALCTVAMLACLDQQLQLGVYVRVARRQGAKPLELRAVLSLSRLFLRQGKQDEARPMLAEIYGRFTEGFDTADLQEARALLQVIP